VQRTDAALRLYLAAGGPERKRSAAPVPVVVSRPLPRSRLGGVSSALALLAGPCRAVLGMATWLWHWQVAVASMLPRMEWRLLTWIASSVASSGSAAAAAGGSCAGASAAAALRGGRADRLASFPLLLCPQEQAEASSDGAGLRQPALSSHPIPGEAESHALHADEASLVADPPGLWDSADERWAAACQPAGDWPVATYMAASYAADWDRERSLLFGHGAGLVRLQQVASLSTRRCASDCGLPLERSTSGFTDGSSVDGASEAGGSSGPAPGRGGGGGGGGGAGRGRGSRGRKQRVMVRLMQAAGVRLAHQLLSGSDPAQSSS
jgi:hypothetical protein